VEFDPETVSPIRSESVLMEGFPPVDEWPLIRKKITNPAMTFEAGQGPARAEGRRRRGGRRLRRLRGRRPAEKPHSDKTEEIQRQRARVFKLADPGRDVTWIVDRSRLGEFEASKALLNLLNHGFLTAVAAVKAQPPAPRPPGAGGAWPSSWWRAPASSRRW